MTEKANPYIFDFDMSIEVAVPIRSRISYKRGHKDGENYLRRYRAGECGLLIKNRYPGNPYHESEERWKEYNRGFTDGCQIQVYIG